MFNDDFCLKNNDITVFEIGWQKQTAQSGHRPYDALSLRLEGECEFIIDKKSVEAYAGDIVYVPANVKYTMNSKKNEKLYVIHFYSRTPQSENIEVFTPTNFNLFKDLFETMHQAYTSKSDGHKFSVISVLYKIISQIYIQTREESLSSYKNLSYTIDYIHSNYTDENISVKKLAEFTMVSENYFRKMFFKKTGTTPLNYINNLRLSLADNMLESEYYTVTQIASLCGFSDPKYFSCMYKKSRGTSPKKHVKRADTSQ